MPLDPFRQLRQHRNHLSLKEYWGPSPPSAVTDAGPFALGDIVWNDAPASNNSALGWLCVLAGADGSTAQFAVINVGFNATFNSASNTTSFTATAAQISGGNSSVDLLLTGALGSGQNITLPTVASLLAAVGPALDGWRLRIINASSGAFSWTVVTNTGWTTSGTLTIAQNTWREFVINITSVPSATATITSVATGTYS